MKYGENFVGPFYEIIYKSAASNMACSRHSYTLYKITTKGRAAYDIGWGGIPVKQKKSDCCHSYIFAKQKKCNITKKCIFL